MDIVYRMTDTATGRKYIGSKKNWLGEGTYFGSPNCRSKRFKKFQLQEEWRLALATRPDSFIFEILEQYEKIDHCELLKRELVWQKKFDVVKSMEYVNAGFAKRGYLGNIYESLNEEEAEKLKVKISVSTKHRYDSMSPEERRALSEKMIGEANPNYGNKWDEEQRKTMQKRMLEYYETNTVYNKGKTWGELVGEDRAEEIKTMLSEQASKRVGVSNSFYGKHHTEETKKKLSQAGKGRKSTNTKKVKIGDAVYEGLVEASKATGVKRTTIWHRIKSKNPLYAEYNYVD